MIQSQVNCSPDLRIEKPEDDWTDKAEAREQTVGCEVVAARESKYQRTENSSSLGESNTYLLHGDRGDHLEDGPGGHQDDEGEGDG